MDRQVREKHSFEILEVIDIKKLIEFYKIWFPNMSIEELEACSDYTNFGIYEDSNLIGAVTYRRLTVIDVNFTHLYLIAVSKSGQGLGSILLNKVKQQNSKVTTWADNGKIKFFLKNNFFIQKTIGYSLQSTIPFQVRAKFCTYGFEKNELKKLRNYWKN
jgi:hypothetical protein